MAPSAEQLVDWYLLIATDHLVTDHVSGDIILEEVQAYLRGQEALLIQYRCRIATLWLMQ